MSHKTIQFLRMTHLRGPSIWTYVPVIEALATLAYDGRRGRFFEAQLIDALKILQRGDVRPGNFTGSWAGAMGHTQFIPTSYLAFAVDFTGDGRRDIWGEDPTDALASTAAYLAKNGWQHGLPWGGEVRLPAGFDPGLLGRGKGRSATEWQALGVTSASGGAVSQPASARCSRRYERTRRARSSTAS